MGRNVCARDHWNVNVANLSTQKMVHECERIYKYINRRNRCLASGVVRFCNACTCTSIVSPSAVRTHHREERERDRDRKLCSIACMISEYSQMFGLVWCNVPTMNLYVNLIYKAWDGHSTIAAHVCAGVFGAGNKTEDEKNQDLSDVCTSINPGPFDMDSGRRILFALMPAFHFQYLIAHGFSDFVLLIVRRYSCETATDARPKNDWRHSRRSAVYSIHHDFVNAQANRDRCTCTFL